MTKKAVSKKTEKILRKMLDYIEQEPRRLEMGRWGLILPDGEMLVDGVDEHLQPAPPCGTVACLAGTCLLVTKAGKDFLKANRAVKRSGDGQSYIRFPESTPEVAADILGIPMKDARRLFLFKKWSSGGGEGWDAELSRRYEKATTPRGRFLAAKARVERFINTGK